MGIKITDNTPRIRMNVSQTKVVYIEPEEPNTYLLRDEEGNEVVGVLVDEETIFDATENDIREGVTAATGEGVTVGTKVIPSYHTSEGYRYIPVGSECTIPLPVLDKYDFTKLQVIVCLFNTTAEDSVSSEHIVVENRVYPVRSAVSISTVTKNAENKSIDLGMINNGTAPLVLRFFTYKEIP